MYLGLVLHSCQASLLKLLNRCQKLISVFASSIVYPALGVIGCFLILGSLTKKIRIVERAATTAAGTQYIPCMFIPRVAENIITMVSSPRMSPSVAKLITRPLDSLLT